MNIGDSIYICEESQRKDATAPFFVAKYTRVEAWNPNHLRLKARKGDESHFNMWKSQIPELHGRTRDEALQVKREALVSAVSYLERSLESAKKRLSDFDVFVEGASDV